MRSLIVDDSPIIRIVVKQCLLPYGHCDEAKNGKEAIEKFTGCAETDERYDLICLDLQMPETDGIQVLHAIRESEKQRGLIEGVKIILITAEDDRNVVLAAIQAGANAYLVKPVSKRDVDERVAAFFPKSNGSAA